MLDSVLRLTPSPRAASVTVRFSGSIQSCFSTSPGCGGLCIFISLDSELSWTHTPHVFVIVLVVLPPFDNLGHLPPGVHITGWQEFQSHFGLSTPRRLWLSDRLRSLLDLAAASGKLRRIFIWGSFVTAKPAPKDLDILLIMAEDFEVDQLPAPAHAIFDSVRARLLFESDVFWARASIGDDLLHLWLDTYQISRTFQRRGIVELELP